MKVGDVLYHCSRTSDEGADIITYADPVAYTTRFNYLTLQPSNATAGNRNGYYLTNNYGEQTNVGWNMIANLDTFKGVFNEGDKLYVDGLTPVDGEVNGYSANAIITSVREQNRAIYCTVNTIEGM